MSKRWPTSVERAQREVLPLHLSLYHAARDYQGGIKAVAAVHGLNPTTLQHKLSPTHEPHKANIDDLEAVLSVTRDPRILDSIGEMVNCVWICPDDYADGDTIQLLAAIGGLHERLGKLIEGITTSAEDGVIDPAERKQLRKLTRRLVEGVLGLEMAAVAMGGELDG